jgi:hypothetical protein
VFYTRKRIEEAMPHQWKGNMFAFSDCHLGQAGNKATVFHLRGRHKSMKPEKPLWNIGTNSFPSFLKRCGTKERFFITSKESSFKGLHKEKKKTEVSSSELRIVNIEENLQILQSKGNSLINYFSFPF